MMLKQGNPKRISKLALCMAGIFVLGMVIVGTGLKLYYQNRWHPNTIVNGLDVSGKTFQDSEQMMQDYVEDYVLHIEGRKDGQLDISSTSIDLQLDFEQILREQYEQQKKDCFLPHFMKKEYELDFPVTYSDEKIDQLIQNAPMLNGDEDYTIIPPKSAYIDYSEEKGYGIIVVEEPGNKIKKDVFRQVLIQALEVLEDHMDLSDEEKYPDVYKAPRYRAEDDVIQNAVETYNQYLLHWITWDMGEGVEEELTPQIINDWLSINKKGKVKFDKVAMEEWIEAFCLKYKTQGKTRTFTTHDGETIEVEGGDYGWCIDYQGTVDQTYKILTKKKKKALDAYIEDPSDENRKKLTKRMEPNYLNTAFQRDYVNNNLDWDPDNYSEVDLSDQMVYVYRDGKLAYSSICVTGLPSDPERATRTGCYYIKDKKEDYVLRGADYETPTKYWVRIMWTGTGYHYLGRSDWGNWSPEIYKTRGSHGCINLQLEDAENIYNLVRMRDAVFIHE